MNIDEDHLERVIFIIHRYRNRDHLFSKIHIVDDINSLNSLILPIFRFGDVYRVEDINTKVLCAMKVEVKKEDRRHSKLKMEVGIGREEGMLSAHLCVSND